MGSSERDTTGHTPQLAKEIFAIGVAQRFRQKHKNDSDRVRVNLNTGVSAANQLIFPIASRVIEGHPITEKHPTLASVAFLLDFGISMGTLLLVLDGHIIEGVATKVVYNVGANVLLDRISRKSPQSTNRPELPMI